MTNEIQQDLEPERPKKTLFQTINQEAVDRPIHQKLYNSKPEKMPKSAALKRLMAIAGDDWDRLGKGLETNMLSTTHTVFKCPASDGDYPDTHDCGVYYQCYQGTPYKHSCQAGLRWNTSNNSCDWKENVDCDRNNKYYRY